MPDAIADPSADRPSTLRALLDSGHRHRSVRAEIRANLLRRMRAGEERFPGIVGFDATVLPHLERALIAGHDIVLLGERGQGKTRLIRSLTGLLDEWSPVVAGCPVNDHPMDPVCPRCRRLAAEEGEKLPVAWRHRDTRYGEKLSTPDIGVGDLIGDVDPVKLAEGRTLDDPETIHYGLIPRTNRGVFCLNELPDLAARIQVALLNVLQERDLQVRGHTLRLPLDMLVVASANPEDYTNRGRIITPLKDRFGAEIRTHYPDDVAAEIALITQEADLGGGAAADDDGAGARPDVPAHLVEVVARFTRLVRSSASVDDRSGVSARFAIAAVETVAASAARRAALTGEAHPVARVCDVQPVVETLRGKVEFESGEEGRETEILRHLLRRATSETFRSVIGGADLAPLTERFVQGATVETGELVSGDELLRRIGPVDGLARLMSEAGADNGTAEQTKGHAAAVLEFAMEGLFLERRLSKDTTETGTVYRT